MPHSVQMRNVQTSIAEIDIAHLAARWPSATPSALLRRMIDTFPPPPSLYRGADWGRSSRCPGEDRRCRCFCRFSPPPLPSSSGRGALSPPLTSRITNAAGAVCASCSCHEAEASGRSGMAGGEGGALPGRGAVPGVCCSRCGSSGVPQST